MPAQDAGSMDAMDKAAYDEFVASNIGAMFEFPPAGEDESERESRQSRNRRKLMFHKDKLAATSRGIGSFKKEAKTASNSSVRFVPLPGCE